MLKPPEPSSGHAPDLDLHSLVSQGYDGASVTSGRCSWVQQRIMEVAPQAICSLLCSCFNLVLVDCVKNIVCASEFFALLKYLYSFLQKPM